MRKTVLSCAILSCVALVGLFAKDPTGGSAVSGRYFFKSKCRSCHGVEGKAPALEPGSRTAAEWRAYLAAGKHRKATEDLSKVATADQVQDLEAYLAANAAEATKPK